MMRLLQCAQPDSFTLTLCPSDEALPPYAILSHTWGKDDDEVTFADLENGTYRNKAGYAKLRFCAEQARRDGFQYIWIDTCCIKKSDLTELSEAITSMFRWYQNAQKCYVYLSDVSSRKRDSDGNIQLFQDSCFRASRWFTRGWTLQELLAPAVVEFYSREGDILGTKTSLAQQIHEITTIPLAALQGTPHSLFTVAERIRWSEKRETKKKEDKAYCLLGIFDVFMPLIYGEGDHALQRLRKKIQKKHGSSVAGALQYSDTQREMATVADWYSHTDFADQQTDQLLHRQSGTGGWFLARSEYLQWREQPKSTLLCPGIPGSGKSVMVATVIDDLQTYFEARTDVVVAYLYCNFNRQTEQDLRCMLATLTRQLFQEQAQLPNAVTALYQKHRERATRPSVDELRNVLQSLACLYSRVFLVIDALDECETFARDDLLKELFRLQNVESNKINVLATTRFVPDIVQQFSGQPQLEVYADNSDIEIYLTSHMTQLARCVSRDFRLQQAITQRLVNAAEGMFLLARLQFESLRDKTNPGQIKDALAELNKGPSALDSEYAKAVNRIELQPPGWQELARKVLMWIMYATRELSIDELCEAIAVDPRRGPNSDLQDYLDDEDQLVSVCHGLVEVDRESRVVRLVHYTTQEYFRKVRDQWLPDGHVKISQSCIAYLSMDVFSHAQCQWGMDLTTTIAQHKLLEYAGKNWGVHARTTQNSQLQADIINFLSHTDHLRFSAMVTLGSLSWKGIYWCNTSYISAAHITSYFGLHHILHSLIQRAEEIDCTDTSLKTPLHYAAEEGHTETVRVLLTQPGTNVNARNEYNRTPLSEAAFMKHIEVIQLLLAQPSIDINAKDKQDLTPLFRAANEGHTEVVQLLLNQPGIDVNTKDKLGDTPLSVSASKGHIEIVELLLKQSGIDVNTKDEFGRTPLSAAAFKGYTEIVKLLLIQPGIDVNTKNKHGCTPLSIVALKGHTEMFKLLLAQPGIDINTKDKHRFAPLSKAALQGYTEMFKLLLVQPGIDVNTENKLGHTPLSVAALKGHTEMFKLLLAQPSIHVNTKDEFGRTPLFIAALKGHTEMFKLLLTQPGIDINTENKLGHTPLSIATLKGHTEIVKLLLTQPGIDVNTENKLGHISLSVAALKGHTEIVELLLTQSGMEATGCLTSSLIYSSPK